MKTAFTVLDVIYSEYALLYSCINKKYSIWIISRSRYIRVQTLRRALRVMGKNALSIETLQQINQNCEFKNFI